MAQNKRATLNKKRLHLSIARKPNSRFKIVLKRHLERLHWKNADLWKESGISKPQISGWLSDAQNRPVSRVHLARLAFTLAKGYASLPGSSIGKGHLELILSELLESTRPLGSNADTFERLRNLPDGRDGRPLSVGWVPVKWLCYDPTDQPGAAHVTEIVNTPQPKGFAADLTWEVSIVSGFTPEWWRFPNYSGLMNGIAQGRVDLVCPILSVLPARMLSLRFSKEIPGKRFRTEILTLGRRTIGRDTRLWAHVIKGEIGEVLVRDTVPYASIEATTTHEDVTAACEAMLRSQSSTVIHCLVADEITCAGILEQDRRFTRAILDGKFDPITLSVAFAARHADQHLIESINSSIDVLDDPQTNPTFIGRLIKHLEDEMKV